MPRIYTRRRGRPGMFLKNAIIYKNTNGLRISISKADLSYLGSGSYGSIHAIRSTNVVFKKHTINPLDMNQNKCVEWEREFHMQKLAYKLCNSELKEFEMTVAKPYAFRYIREDSADSSNIKILTNYKSASACIFTMDRIVDGPKWNKYLVKPRLQSSIPPYIFMGSIQTAESQITLNMLKYVTMQSMPNDAHSFCLDPGSFGHKIQEYMIHAFFILVGNGIMPRDIEYVADGQKYTQTLATILDFNEVKTIEERAQIYGEYYSPEIDIAHVYIDLCGLRVGDVGNPMARYDAPTPQWKFLCNPLVCPTTFLRVFESYRSVADIILQYAFSRKMKCLIQKANIKDWKPLFVTKQPTENPIGHFTDAEYLAYRNSQCVFYSGFNSNISSPSPISSSKTAYYVTDDPSDAFVYDRFVEFDIQFQHYILASLLHSGKTSTFNGNSNSDDFFGMLEKATKERIHIPVDEDEWNGMSLF